MAVCGFVQPAPLFPIWIVAGDRGIQEVRLGDPAPGCLRNDQDPVVLEAARQLQAYFRGDLREFDLPLAATGTPFQHRVWEALLRIPYGETCTYQDLARSSNPRPGPSARPTAPIPSASSCPATA